MPSASFSLTLRSERLGCRRIELPNDPFWTPLDWRLGPLTGTARLAHAPISSSRSFDEPRWTTQWSFDVDPVDLEDPAGERADLWTPARLFGALGAEVHP